MMYDELEAKLHDVFWEAEGEAAELPVIEYFLGRYPGTALELGCGSGRLMLPLLEKGYLVEGLDNSADMLELCRRHATDVAPVLHQADIEHFHAGALYGAIIIPAFTLQLLCRDKMTAILENIHRHLQPGGGLYMTTFIPWAEITGELEDGEWFLDREVALPGGGRARCHTRFRIQRLSQVLSREHRYEILDANDQVKETSNSSQELCWYWPREMAALLRDAGFTVEEVIGDFALGAACDEDSQIITCIASGGSAISPREATSR